MSDERRSGHSRLVYDKATRTIVKQANPAMTPSADALRTARKILERVNLIETFEGQKLSPATGSYVVTSEQYKTRAELEAEIADALLAAKAEGREEAAQRMIKYYGHHVESGQAAARVIRALPAPPVASEETRRG